MNHPPLWYEKAASGQAKGCTDFRRNVFTLRAGTLLEHEAGQGDHEPNSPRLPRQTHTAVLVFFCMGSGDQTQVLMFPQYALYD